jgi:hypothetical protein
VLWLVDRRPTGKSTGRQPRASLETKARAPLRRYGASTRAWAPTSSESSPPPPSPSSCTRRSPSASARARDERPSSAGGVRPLQIAHGASPRWPLRPVPPRLQLHWLRPGLLSLQVPRTGDDDGRLRYAPDSSIDRPQNSAWRQEGRGRRFQRPPWTVSPGRTAETLAPCSAPQLLGSATRPSLAFECMLGRWNVCSPRGADLVQEACEDLSPIIERACCSSDRLINRLAELTSRGG